MHKVKAASLYFHTLRHLRARQFIARARMKLTRPRASDAPAPALAVWLHPWQAPVWKRQSLFAPDCFVFLAQAHTLHQASDWDNPAWPQLWRYNLHYFDDLDSTGAAERRPLQLAWMRRWVEQNPPRSGTAWDPYPTSLRVVNWVKFCSGTGLAAAGILDSLAQQTRWLRQRLEYHLLANHLLVNAKALIFAGAFFSGPEAARWLGQGLAILGPQLQEQFLADGGHFELSPMYHAALLWDVLELIQLARCSGQPLLLQHQTAWQEVATRALRWLQLMCHSDAEISFFNDAALGIAPPLSAVLAFAGQLGISTVAPPLAAPGQPPRLTRLQASGYARVDWSDALLLADVGPVGPDYQPGHAHADTLSFELSVAGQRVIVNCGTSQYGVGPERQAQRSTAAHSTLEVDGENSSEVWAGFRVARRARPLGYKARQRADGVEIQCAHDGYTRLPGQPQHQRIWQATAGNLRIVDTVTGPHCRAVAYFHLHPAVALGREGHVLLLQLPGEKTLRFEVQTGEIEIHRSSWHPGFGEAVDTHCIAVTAQQGQCACLLNW